MTEEEAKTKWCPFARIRDRNGVAGFNRPEQESFGHREGIGGENHCIGSACMAWRWAEVPLPEGRELSGQTVVSTTAAKHFGWPVRRAIGGYCGLAGAPQ